MIPLAVTSSWTRRSARIRAPARTRSWRSLNSGEAAILEGHGLAGDDVLERAALLAREHGRVDLLGDVGVVGQDDAAARTGEGLVRGGGGHVRVRHRGGVQPGGDEPGEVGHVHHQVGADRVGDPAELGEVELAGVGGPAGHDEGRLVLLGQALHLGHVDPVVIFADLVRDDVVQPAGEVDLHAVGQVPAVGQVQAHDGVARADQGVHDGGVGLRAGVRLDVGVLGAEQGLDPVDRELFDHVDVLTAAVVALARVALGVLVRQHRPLRLHDGAGGVVLRGDHFQAVALPGQLGVDLRGDFRVQGGQVRVQARGDDLLKRRFEYRSRAHSSPPFLDAYSWAESSGPSDSAATLKSQPAPYGSLLISEGSSTTAGLVSVTSPVTGA